METKRQQLDALCLAMIGHDAGDPKRVQHFLKVQALAALIGRQEHVDAHTLFILEAAGYLHDIGIRLAEERYGYQNGQLQQELGPAAARTMLEKHGFEEADIERICWLIAHHHTYTDIEGADYQILVEADFLVDLYEKQADRQAVGTAYDRIFRTETGRRICREMLLEERQL